MIQTALHAKQIEANKLYMLWKKSTAPKNCNKKNLLKHFVVKNYCKKSGQSVFRLSQIDFNINNQFGHNQLNDTGKKINEKKKPKQCSNVFECFT